MNASTGARPWLELRVHGVSGTPAVEMLEAPHVVQVAGDSGRKVYQRADCLGRPVPADTDGRILEAYHWGDLTSGSARQALWLLLVPFGIVNAAQFMLPPPTRPGSDGRVTPTSRSARGWHAICGALLRVLALGLTALFALTTAIICMDLIAWRKADTVSWLDGVAGGTVAVGGMAAALGVGVAFYLVGGRLRDVTAPPPSETAAALRGTTALARPAFYGGDPNSPDLRRLHLAAGVCVVALLACAPLEADEGGLAPVLKSTAAVILVVLAVLSFMMGDPGGSASLNGTDPTQHRLVLMRNRIVKVTVIGLLAAVWVIVVVSGVLLWGTTRANPGQPLPGSVELADWLLVVVACALVALLLSNVVLALTTGLLRGSDDPFRPFARGLATSLATSVGVFLAIGFSAGFTFATSQLLGVSNDQIAPLLERVAHAWGLTAIATGLGLVVVVGRFVGTRRSMQTRVAAAYEIGGRDTVSGGSSRPREVLRRSVRSRVTRATYAARLKTLIEPVFWVYAGLGLALTIVAGVEDRWGALPAPVGWLSDTSADGRWQSTLVWIGTTVLAALAAGLLVVGRSAVREKTKRRGANVVWDVISFWPHSTHPFVPVPYAQLVIPDLVRHIRRQLSEHPSPGREQCDVVLAAHSQGSLIATASLIWLRPDELERVGLVTFGSQIRVAFARAFPHYVNGAFVRHLAVGDRRTGRPRRWVNLYRETDAIAGPVLSWRHSVRAATDAESSPGRLETWSRGIGSPDEDRADAVDDRTGARLCAFVDGGDAEEWRLLDPPLPRRDARLVDTSIRGHSAYFADPDWRRVVARVRGVPGSRTPDANRRLGQPPRQRSPGDTGHG